MKYFCPPKQAGSFVSVHTAKMYQLQLKNLIVLIAPLFLEYISSAYGEREVGNLKFLIDETAVSGALVFILVCG